jgi:hypothetical protein
MQISSVKAIEGPPASGLDLLSSPDEDFALDKLRSIFERLYMTIVSLSAYCTVAFHCPRAQFIGLLTFVQHVARLRSWKEKTRTIAFCIGYFTAWAFNLVVPALLSMILLLVVFPPARRILFPPAPIAAVDTSTGTLKTPKSGTLASESFTGAPEVHKGQAVEQEASNFVSVLASMAAGAAMGKKPVDAGAGSGREEQKGSIGTKLPDPTEAVGGSKDAREAAEGRNPTAVHDKTKVMHSIAYDRLDDS